MIRLGIPHIFHAPIDDRGISSGTCRGGLVSIKGLGLWFGVRSSLGLGVGVGVGFVVWRLRLGLGLEG